MTDRELLELAAKATGIDYIISGGQLWTTMEGSINKHTERWNPLANDGQALRLAVNLGLAVIPYPIYAKPKHSVIAKQYSQARVLRGESEDVRIEEIQIYRDDPASATRRAIVRAAAELGKSM